MELAETITTTADPASAWSAVTSITTWPQWTASMTSVEPVDGTELRPGARFRIRQPGMPALVWQVSEVHPGESFIWVARSTGVRTVAYHRVSGGPDGGATIAIGVRQTGPLAWLVGLLTGGRTRRYLRMESAGLKAASEAAPSAT